MLSRVMKSLRTNPNLWLFGCGLALAILPLAYRVSTVFAQIAIYGVVGEPIPHSLRDASVNWAADMANSELYTRAMYCGMALGLVAICVAILRD